LELTVSYMKKHENVSINLGSMAQIFVFEILSGARVLKRWIDFMLDYKAVPRNTLCKGSQPLPDTKVFSKIEAKQSL